VNPLDALLKESLGMTTELALRLPRLAAIEKSRHDINWSHPCALHKYHAPEGMRRVVHHVWPKAWGGPESRNNVLPVCFTGHDDIHLILDEYLRLARLGLGPRPSWNGRGRTDPKYWPGLMHFGAAEREIAAIGWKSLVTRRVQPFTYWIDWH
jgi:hypothetical protein